MPDNNKSHQKGDNKSPQKDNESDIEYWKTYYSKKTGLDRDDKKILDMIYDMYTDRMKNEESLFVFLLFVIFGLGSFTCIYLFIKLIPYAFV